MAGESPAAVLFDAVDQKELAVADATAIPLGTHGLLAAGKSPTNKSRFVAVDEFGRLLVVDSAVASTVGTTTTVLQSMSAVTLLAASARNRALIYNNAPTKLYLKFSAGVTTLDFSTILGPYGEYPVVGYTGVVEGVWGASGAGAALVTEFS